MTAHPEEAGALSENAPAGRIRGAAARLTRLLMAEAPEKLQAGRLRHKAEAADTAAIMASRTGKDVRAICRGAEVLHGRPDKAAAAIRRGREKERERKAG